MSTQVNARPDGGMGHTPLLAPRINSDVARVDPAVLDALRSKYVPDLSDAVGQLYTLDCGVRPLYPPSHCMVGQALTAKCPPGDNLTVHMALSMVQDGDILVVDSRQHVASCGTGGGSLVLPARQGLRGVVSDGGWRDIQEIQNLDVPLFGRGVSPFSPPKQRIGEINVPVTCGGVIVCAGDLVIGDENGVVIIPAKAAEYIIDRVPDYAPKLREEWSLKDLETRAVRVSSYISSMRAKIRPDAIAGF